MPSDTMNPPTTDTVPPAAKAKSEKEFLNRQAEEAVTAMRVSLREFQHKLKHGLSLETAAKDHPWWTVAAGAVAGFATAMAVVPTKRESELKELAELQRALHPSTAESNSDKGDKSRSKVSHTLVKEAFALIRPVAISAISGMVAARQNSEPQPQEATDTSLEG